MSLLLFDVQKRIRDGNKSQKILFVILLIQLVLRSIVMSIKKSIFSSLFVAMTLTQCAGTAQAGGAATGGATSIQQTIAQVEFAAQTSLQTASTAVQSNQYVMQGMQYAKETAAYIRQGLQLEALYNNLTNPQFYLGLVSGNATWQQGSQLYGATTGSSSRSTRDSVYQAQNYASIMSPRDGGQPSTAALQAYNTNAASAALSSATQADAKQADLAQRSQTSESLVKSASTDCIGTTACDKAKIALAGEQNQINIGIASTLATQQAAAAKADTEKTLADNAAIEEAKNRAQKADAAQQAAIGSI